MIVDKGVAAAAALLIGGVALAVEGLRAAGAVELGVGGRTRGLLRDKLLPLQTVPSANCTLCGPIQDQDRTPSSLMRSPAVPSVR